MKQFQRRVPLTSAGLTLFRTDWPEQLILEDEDNGLHIYRLAEDGPPVSRVIVAFGNDYAFSRFATEDEDKEWRQQAKTGKVIGEEEPEEDIVAEMDSMINSIGSTIAS